MDWDKIAEAEHKTSRVLAEVACERVAQDAKWGEQNHPDGLDVEEHFDGRAQDGANLGWLIESWGRRMLDAKSDRGAEGSASYWVGILMEEVGEAMQAQSASALRAELIQVAAVAVSWVEAIDRRAAVDRAVAIIGDGLRR